MLASASRAKPRRRRTQPQGARCLRPPRRAGASFFPDIVRGTRHLKAEVETALWELVAAGSGHGRRLRQPPRAHRSAPARRPRQRPVDASPSQRRTMGPAPRPRPRLTGPSGRGRLLDAVAPLRCGISRTARARVTCRPGASCSSPSAVSKTAVRFAAAGSSAASSASSSHCPSRSNRSARSDTAPRRRTSSASLPPTRSISSGSSSLGTRCRQTQAESSRFRTACPWTPRHGGPASRSRQHGTCG